ncbi:MAG: cellulase family glycosylhydrolase [Myxococcales bacterium]|nr:cellulase family glycosylhydrolase [Myxococcales bacterium]
MRAPIAPPRSAALAALLLAACGDDGSGSGSASETASGGETTGETTGGSYIGTCDPPLKGIPPESARLVVDAGGRLRDPDGRVILLRGVNTGGRSKWAPFVPFPIADDLTIPEFRAAADAFFDRLRPWGLNVVRLPFSWEAFEPTQGAYDYDYLDFYEAMVDSAWSRRLAVIVDFHQDIYASPFCGDGFPPWTLADPDPGPPRHDCTGWGLKYFTDAGVREAFDRFWADDDGIQSAFLEMWSQVLLAVGDKPGVIGFEIINEPGWGTATSVDTWKSETLLPFYDAAIAELRPLAPDLLVFYDDPGVDALAGADVEMITPAGDGLVYAPHLYDVTLLAGEAPSGVSYAGKIDGMVAHREAAGHAILLGEFGIGAGAEALGGLEWIRDLMATLDDAGISATLWECSQNEELWNEEDLSVLGPGGEERPLLDAYVRPYLRALAGDDPSFAWDPEAGVASASWVADGGVTEIAWPLRRFPEAPSGVDLSGEGACYTYDPWVGALRVQASAGAAVSLVINE